MKNMLKLLVSDTLLTMDNIQVMFDSNNIHETDPLVDSVVENLQIVFDNINTMCSVKEFNVCIKVLDRQLTFYSYIREEAGGIDDLVMIVDALKEVCMRYNVM